MGKTLQTICLFLNDKVGPAAAGKAKRAAPAPSAPALGPSLVVVPSSALWQWHDEIARSTDPHALKVEVFHGASRGGASFAPDVDVVLTTYAVVEHAYRAQVECAKVKCPFCARAMLPTKLKLHFKVNAQTRASSSSPCLAQTRASSASISRLGSFSAARTRC